MVGSNATILVVEDDPSMADQIERELTAAGFDVLVAPDGEQALEVQARESADLMVLDWSLPRLDGLAVLRRMRAAGEFAAVLMLTGRSEETSRVLGLEAGADDYLCKPFTIPELLARIRALLRRIDWGRAKTSPSEVDLNLDLEETLEDGELVLDPVAREVTLRGRVLDLSVKEYSLLFVFLRCPGRALTRLYLLEAVWGEGHATSERSVDFTVFRLRQRLGARGEAVETVRGVGYRWRSSDTNREK